jgi:hypothetical protein
MWAMTGAVSRAGKRGDKSRFRRDIRCMKTVC